MTTFRFALQKVLDWRRTQLEVEEVQFRQQLARLAELDRTRARWSAQGASAEQQVREWKPVAGSELEALGSFRLHVKLKETELAIPRAQCRKELDRQQNVMLETRRRLRLLERLRERRQAEWVQAGNKELADLAAESYLAKWKPR